MRYLLDKGADINAQTNSGRTPLMYAVQFGHVNLVIMMLGRKDLMVEASDLEGFTALLIAIEMGDPGTVLCAQSFHSPAVMSIFFANKAWKWQKRCCVRAQILTR